MNQSHGSSAFREPAGAGAVPTSTLMRWVETAPGSGIFDLVSSGVAGAAFVKSAPESSAAVTMLDLTSGVASGDAAAVLVRDLASVY